MEPLDSLAKFQTIVSCVIETEVVNISRPVPLLATAARRSEAQINLTLEAETGKNGADVIA